LTTVDDVPVSDAVVNASPVGAPGAVVSTVTAETFAGPLLYQIAEATPGVVPIDRTVINAWLDPRIRYGGK